ncbi:MAG: ABC transporter permease [Actinomycetota bacterium]
MSLVAQATGGFFSWEWVVNNLDDIWDRTIEHLLLTAIAVAVGMVVSLALSLIALRYRRTYAPITWFAGVLYTIPSLALFAFLVPLTGLSVLTAEIGLVSYTLLILIRNTVAGIDGVPPATVESARGMGYKRSELFLAVELPLALPVIMAGVRIAAVTTIGLVTVTALIGQGGLGFFILRGLNLFYSPIGTTQIVVGTALSVVLAVAVDVSLVGIERLATPWARRKAPA